LQHRTPQFTRPVGAVSENLCTVTDLAGQDFSKGIIKVDDREPGVIIKKQSAFRSRIGFHGSVVVQVIATQVGEYGCIKGHVIAAALIERM